MVQRNVKSLVIWSTVAALHTHVNRHMGSVDLSDQLTQYYSVQPEVVPHIFSFVYIVATNSYILYRERTAYDPPSFLEALTASVGSFW